MTLEVFKSEILKLGTDELLLSFVQKNFFHGNPFVCTEDCIFSKSKNEDDYFDFRKLLADKFDVNYYEVFIVGSGKFGFSLNPDKDFKMFDLESDLDISIVNDKLFDTYNKIACDLMYANEATTQIQKTNTNKFLRYFAKGWMRPDLLPDNSEQSE
jgi:hypothetical protein